MRKTRIDLRSVRRYRAAFVGAIVLSVAAAASGVTLSLIDMLVTRPLRISDRHLIVTLGGLAYGDGLPNALGWWRQAEGLEELALHDSGDVFLSDVPNDRWVRVSAVSPSFFAVFRIYPILGRQFDAQEFGEVRSVALISETLWSSQFDRSPTVVGSSIRLNARAYTIVGVMPDHLNFPVGVHVWIPGDPIGDAPFDYVNADSGTPQARRNAGLIGRLDRHTSREVLTEQLFALLGRANRELAPRTGNNYGDNVNVRSIDDFLAGSNRQTFYPLATASLLMLAVCSVNWLFLSVTGELLRRRETAIKRALGASSRRIVGEQFASIAVMSAAVALASGLMALALLRVSSHALQGVGLWTDHRPSLLLIAVGVSTSLAFGACAVPAGAACVMANIFGRGEHALNDQRDAQGARPNARFGLLALVTLQIAAAFVMVVGASTAAMAFRKETSGDNRINSDSLTSASVTLRGRVRSPEEFHLWREEVLAAAASVGGASASVSSVLPFFARDKRLLEIRSSSSSFLSAVNEASADYLGALGVRMRSGRPYVAGERDVAVINARLEERLFGQRSAVGSVVTVAGSERHLEIVGVSEDVPTVDSADSVTAELYRPYDIRDKGAQRGSTLHVLLRCHTNCERASEQLFAEIREVPRTDVHSVVPVESIIKRFNAPQQFRVSLWTWYAAVSMLLAFFGLMTLVASAVTARRREVTIRMALGAPPWRVVALLLSHAIKASVLGVTIGVLVAIAVSKYISSVFADFGGLRYEIVLLSCGLFLVTGLLAGSRPTWRVARRLTWRHLSVD